MLLITGIYARALPAMHEPSLLANSCLSLAGLDFDGLTFAGFSTLAGLVFIFFPYSNYSFAK